LLRTGCVLEVLLDLLNLVLQFLIKNLIIFFSLIVIFFLVIVFIFLLWVPLLALSAWLVLARLVRLLELFLLERSLGACCTRLELLLLLLELLFEPHWLVRW
jgi:hypothetical protein